MRIGSIYKYNSPVRFSRRIIIFVLDFLLFFFLTLVGFSVCDNVLANAEGTQSHKITAQSGVEQQELLAMIEEARLGYMINQNICGTDVMAKEYVRSLCSPASEDYVDPLFYYYETFKKEHKEDFSEVGDRIGTDYAAARILEELGENGEAYFDTESQSPYPVLTEPAAKALEAWLSDSQEITQIGEESYNGKQICEDLEYAYQVVLAQAREDFTQGYGPYIAQYQVFGQLRDQLLQQKLVQAILVYVVLTVLYYVLCPILFWHGASCTDKLFHMTPCTRNGEMVPIWSVLLKWLVETVTYFNVLHVVFVILYSGNSGMMFMQEIAGSLKFSHLYFLSVGIMILSAACCAFGKKNCCTLSDLVSWQLMKDVRD